MTFRNLLLFYVLVKIIECQSNPCSNGTCSKDERSDGYVCTCEDGFYGTNCDKGTKLLLLTNNLTKNHLTTGMEKLVEVLQQQIASQEQRFKEEKLAQEKHYE